jgi:hypothetical protein
MDYKRTLRWLEPYGGWIEGDTGFCNRIFHWEIAYEINRNCNFSYKIMLEKLDWPELPLIYLPDTSTHINSEYENGVLYDKDYQKLRFLTVFNPEDKSVKLASKLTKQIIETMFRDKEFYLSNSNHWYSDFGYNEINYLYQQPIDPITGKIVQFNPRPLSLIRLRHTFIEDFLRKNTFDVVGIHIRRNAGVSFTEEDLETLPTDVKEKYLKIHKKTSVCNRELKYVPDQKYIDLIDKMLKLNPEQVFYISTDLPISLIKNFKKIYGNKIITRNDFYGPIRDHLINGGVNVHNLKKGDVIENVIDLFALSFCKFLIKSDRSTWSEFAENYRNQPSFSINDDWQTQIRPKYIRPMWGQPGEYNFNGDDLHYKKVGKSLYLDELDEMDNLTK